MFYCNPCARKRDWPVTLGFVSWGRCEICEKTTTCNEVPSKYLPLPNFDLSKFKDLGYTREEGEETP